MHIYLVPVCGCAETKHRGVAPVPHDNLIKGVALLPTLPPMNSTQNKPLQLSSLHGFTDAGDLFYTSKAGAEGGRKSGGCCRRVPPPLCNGARHTKAV